MVQWALHPKASVLVRRVEGTGEEQRSGADEDGGRLE